MYISPKLEAFSQGCTRGAPKAAFSLLTYVGIDFYNLLDAAGFHERGGDPLLHGQADALRGLDPDGRGTKLKTTAQLPPPRPTRGLAATACTNINNTMLILTCIICRSFVLETIASPMQKPHCVQDTLALHTKF